MSYDEQNIFAKILRGEISCEKIYEDDSTLFFNDINPSAKIHVLGIPKAPCVDFSDFINTCNEKTVSHFFKKVEFVVNILEINKSGYRIISNSGKDGKQEVLHFHVHILGGKNLGRMIN